MGQSKQSLLEVLFCSAMKRIGVNVFSPVYIKIFHVVGRKFFLTTPNVIMRFFGDNFVPNNGALIGKRITTSKYLFSYYFTFFASDKIKLKTEQSAAEEYPPIVLKENWGKHLYPLNNRAVCYKRSLNRIFAASRFYL